VLIAVEIQAASAARGGCRASLAHWGAKANGSGTITSMSSCQVAVAPGKVAGAVNEPQEIFWALAETYAFEVEY
jgi:hypothetical protein